MAFLAPVVGIAQTNETPEKTLSKEEQKIETKKNIDLAKIKAQIEIAQQKRILKEVGKKGNPEPATPSSRDINKIGIASKNKAETTVTMEEVDILDANGKKIGSAISGSEAWKKLKERESKDNRAIEKEKAKQNRPIIVNPNDGYGNGGYYGGDGNGVGLRRHNIINPEDSRNEPRPHGTNTTHGTGQ